MRSRNIKPNFFKNDLLAECSFQARLLFIGLWCYADKKGICEYRPKRIKAELFPYENKTIEPMIKELEDKKFIILYSINGDNYLKVLSFDKHQHPHHTEKDSEYPDFNGCITGNKPLLTGDNPSDSLIPDSLIPERGLLKEENNIYSNIFDHWNSLKIIIHKKLTDEIKRKINPKLKEYSEDEILKAMSNYIEVLNSDKYMFTYKWTLIDFMGRGIHKFVDAADPLTNFIKRDFNSNNETDDMEGWAEKND